MLFTKIMELSQLLQDHSNTSSDHQSFAVPLPTTPNKSRDMETVSISSLDEQSDQTIIDHDLDKRLVGSSSTIESMESTSSQSKAVEKVVIEHDYEYLKLPTIDYQSVEQLFKYDLEKLEEYGIENGLEDRRQYQEEYLCEHLNAFPVIKFPEGTSTKDQLDMFFDSPVPFIHFGDKNDYFSGEWLEYNLRELVGAKNEASILDLIALKDEECYIKELEDLYMSNTQIQWLGRTMNWGKKADGFADFWDDSIEDLVSVAIFDRKRHISMLDCIVNRNQKEILHFIPITVSNSHYLFWKDRKLWRLQKILS